MYMPTADAERKALPVFTFLTKYFPLAFLEVVRVAVYGDKQHGNTGAEIRWAREKSTDQLNTALRHLMDYGMGQKWDIDGRAHLAKAIWRLSAQLQLDEEIEIEKAKPDAYYPPRTATEIENSLYPTPTRLDAMLNEALAATEERIRRAHPLTPRPPNICSDCGVDLNHGFHSALCLTQEV